MYASSPQNLSLIPPKVKLRPMRKCTPFHHRIFSLLRPRLRPPFSQALILTGSSCKVSVGRRDATWRVPLPLVAPGQPGQSESLFFRRILIENRYFSPSRLLPASPGNRNPYLFKGISIKIDAFLHPGCSRPAWAIKITTF